MNKIIIPNVIYTGEQVPGSTTMVFDFFLSMRDFTQWVARNPQEELIPDRQVYFIQDILHNYGTFLNAVKAGKKKLKLTIEVIDDLPIM